MNCSITQLIWLILVYSFFGWIIETVLLYWDYSGIPFNLDGRVNLLYCFFWGIAAVIWIKVCYPRVSALALIRYDQRAGGPAAQSGWERIIDTHFDDEKMGKIYPSAKSR